MQFSTPRFGAHGVKCDLRLPEHTVLYKAGSARTATQNGGTHVYFRFSKTNFNILIFKTLIHNSAHCWVNKQKLLKKVRAEKIKKKKKPKKYVR